MKKNLESPEDLAELVKVFYDRVKKDDLIGPIFINKIGDHWDEHLVKIQNFWSTLLLGTDTYHGRPFPPHIPLGLQPEHFKRWLEIFFQTVDDLYQGSKADEIKMRALNIGRNFLINIQHIHSQKP